MTTDENDFDLAPGDRIRRVDLHARYGGSGQGGISPSARTSNVFLFSEAERGRQHGYVDGWKSDRHFHYTGEGQRGDQEFRGGNAAIQTHLERKRSLRLFDGASQTIQYAGEFTLAIDQPFYRADAPETNDGPMRSVIMFRLLPVDTNAPATTEAAIAEEAVLEIVPIEERLTEKMFQNPSHQPTEAERREALLIDTFCSFLNLRGIDAVRNRIIPPGEVHALYTDIYLPRQHVLIEAKGTVERGSFRTAIGQLADYKRFLIHPRCAILLPSKPRSDLMALAMTEAIDVYWRDGATFAGTGNLI